MADMAVVKTAHATAVSMGASHKVLLALFEAAIVESGFRNLNYGDRDSVGYLQQRPSQGWANPMDVPTATRSFVSKANPIQGNYSTAGQLAQAVQRSAFPLKYDAAKAQAEALLASMGGAQNVSALDGATPLGVGDSLDALTNTLKVLSMPDFWKRIGVFVAGVLLVGFALRSQLGKAIG
jgi:hypothetical protein